MIDVDLLNGKRCNKSEECLPVRWVNYAASIISRMGIMVSILRVTIDMRDIDYLSQISGFKMILKASFHPPCFQLDLAIATLQLFVLNLTDPFEALSTNYLDLWLVKCR